MRHFVGPSVGDPEGLKLGAADKEGPDVGLLLGPEEGVDEGVSLGPEDGFDDGITAKISFGFVMR